ncbi:hypothetical protein [Frischella perrara]|uniref:hypothetical protein n=1 Tax=Frischella perrara TaxID=1267021 RepID=UPI0023F33FCA|nr:hypothetical protein [Frischella perrara]
MDCDKIKSPVLGLFIARQIFTQYYRGVKFILARTEHYVTRNNQQISPDFNRPRTIISNMRSRIEPYTQNELN